MIIDTHAHVDVADYDEDREAVIERARENGVQYMVNIGCDVESSYRSMNWRNNMTSFTPPLASTRMMSSPSTEVRMPT